MARVAELMNAKHGSGISVEFLLEHAPMRVLPRWAFAMKHEDLSGSPTRWAFA